MAYNTNVPNGSQSPGLFPVQNNENFSVLQNLINREHIFNASPSVGDNSCTHRQVTLTSRADPVSLPAGTNGMLYLNQSGALSFYNGVSIGGFDLARAFVTWDNSGNILGASRGVTSVTHVGSNAVYDIVFPVNALPSTNVQICLNCIEPSTNPVICKVESATFTTVHMRVLFINTTPSLVSTITKASLIVFGG